MADTFLIDELSKKENIEDDNKIIVEDSEDTKQSTIKNLKKSFNGDTKDPSSLLFYSSKMTDEIKSSLQRDLSAKASMKDYESLKKSIDDIIQVQSESDTKDIELIIARDGEENLKDRLDRDKNSAANRVLNKYKRTLSGNRVFLGDFTGYADVLVDTKVAGNLVVSSINHFNIEDMRGANDVYMSYSDYGFSYTQFAIRDNKFLGVYVPMNNVPAGTYFFSANLYNDPVVNDNGETVTFKLPTNVNIGLKFTDRSVQYIDMEINNLNSNLFYFNFTSTKILKEISFVFPEENFVEGSVLRFENVMLSSNQLLNEFVPYSVKKYPVSSKQYVYDVRINRSEIYFEGFSCNVIVDYYDDKYTTEYIIDHLSNLEKNFNEDVDQCGLITNYGTYNFFASNTTNKNENNSFIESIKDERYVRNGHRSVKMTYTSAADIPTVCMEIKEKPDTINYVTFLFYIDKYTYYYMDEDAITLCMVSDKPNIYPPNNYFQKIIPKNCLIQGWNSIKFTMEEFETVGNPLKNDINNILIKLSNNSNLLNQSIYLNSIIFNQTMKPTLLLGFNGIYDNTFDYTLPILSSKGLECTIFLNDSQTLSSSEMNSLMMYHSSYLDIGQFGCSPNKELLLIDDNYREQYNALKNIKSHLQTNYVYSPIAYSAPYGDLRPITVNLLRDLGYKIAKTGEDGFCNFFSKKDLCIPSLELNNDTDIDYVKSKIITAINTGQAIAISTYDVTEYGDEINVKKSVFEDLIEYIESLVDTDKIDCLSYKSFYEKCIK